MNDRTPRSGSRQSRDADVHRRAWPTRSKLLTAGATVLLLGAMATSVSVSCSKSSSSVTTGSSDTSLGFTAMRDEEALSSAEFRGALLSAGLDPAALTAAGVTAQELPGVLSDARDYLTEHIADLRAAASSAASNSHTADRLTRAAQAGVASQEDLSQLATARANAATASGQRATILGALRTAAIADLSEAKRSAITILAGASDHTLPIHYRLASHTEAETVALRDALANLRIAAKLGSEADGESTSLVNAANANQDTAAAAARMSGLPAITTAWESGTAQ
jgi:hypothetical protein